MLPPAAIASQAAQRAAVRIIDAASYSDPETDWILFDVSADFMEPVSADELDVPPDLASIPASLRLALRIERWTLLAVWTSTEHFPAEPRRASCGRRRSRGLATETLAGESGT